MSCNLHPLVMINRSGCPVENQDLNSKMTDWIVDYKMHFILNLVHSVYIFMSLGQEDILS